MPVPRAVEPSTPRGRFRDQVRSDAKSIALEQLADGGLPAVSLNAIAKQLGVSGPALYRYFAGRDDLLDQLVIDAYGDLATAVEGAVAKARRDPAQAYADAYRGWARTSPHRYRLLFGQPAAGHDGHRPELVAATARLMTLLVQVVAARPGDPPPVGAKLAKQLRAWAASRGIDAEPPGALRAISAWAQIHGWTRLEIDGNFASMGVDPALLPVDPFTA